MKRTYTQLFVVLLMAIMSSCAVNQADRSSQELTDLKREAGSTTQAKRKIISNVHLTLQVENVDTANHALTSLATAYNGYTTEVGDARTIIRVKSEMLDKVLERIGEIGTIKDQTASGVDVTDEYFDHQIRLENAQKTRDRYLELLKIAKTVDEIIKIEKELERLNETIDLIKGRMNRLAHLSDYATIHITFTERVKPGLVGYVFVGLYKSVEWLFVRS